MKNYELIYLIPPDLTEKDLKEITERIKNFIQEENGVLIKTREFEKRKLGYPINKQREGFWGSLDFSLNPEGLKNFAKKLKADSQILRYVILTKKVLKEMPSKKTLLKTTEQNKPLARRPKDRKVELKEIDKKIEEILRE